MREGVEQPTDHLKGHKINKQIDLKGIEINKQIRFESFKICWSNRRNDSM